MKNFKVICKIDKGAGIEDYPIFVKAEDEIEAESNAKYYWIIGKGSENGWGYCGVKTITLV